MKLYKYRSLNSLDFVLDIIIHDRLYCPEYSDLNDPFEGVFISLITNIFPEAPPLDNLGMGSPNRLSEFAHYARSDIFQQYLDKNADTFNDMSALTKKSPFEKLTNFMSEFNENFNTHKIISNNTQSTIKKISNIGDLVSESIHSKVCSLSSDLHDVKLWSHYADSHRGIAIELDFENHMDDVEKVDYLSSLPIMGGLLSDAHTPKDVLTKKSKHWEYESEYRIITDQEYYFVGGRIKGIYFGIDTPEEHKEIILAVTHQFGINLYDTKIDTDKIEISVGDKYK